ncbi:hypothetical protein GCM10027290_20330 [Micromonospora sonneratiae]|uniref:Excreted virulence factor EspC, type VII ESX diderm n=1 Tax=Micromonospora sonneratiae TaxID=1184706 RepID=A0ABW3YG35_9ACTN
MPTNDGDIALVYDAFEVERRKWKKQAGQMADLRRITAGLNLMSTAFFCGNPATAIQLSKTYDEIYELVRTLMTAAEEEFGQISDALKIAEDLYDGSDKQSASTLEAIYGKRDA